MKKTIIACVLLFFLASCTNTNSTHTAKEYSEILIEKGTVEDLVFTPKNHGDDLSPGMTMSGKLTVSFTSIDIPEKYAVVFKCHDHGVKFVIQDNQEKAKEMWNRLKRDQEVTIYYKNVYEVTYQNDSVTERKLIDLEFVDAK
jgi:hypothetical protein